MKSRHLPHSPKLVWLVSGTPSGAAVKSSRCSDEIVRFAHDEIKSVLFIPHVSADFIAQRFHPRSGFIPSVRTDLVERGCKKSPEKNEDTRKAKTSG